MRGGSRDAFSRPHNVLHALVSRQPDTPLECPAVPVVQLLLAAVACFGLWRLCRAQPRIVVAGFLVRALVGQALFWISYLRLPVARSLQLGDGFWFFAVDGRSISATPRSSPREARLGSLLDADQYPSRFFVQVLALSPARSAAWLGGHPAELCGVPADVRDRRAPGPEKRHRAGGDRVQPGLDPLRAAALKDTLFMLLIVAVWWPRSGDGKSCGEPAGHGPVVAYAPPYGGGLGLAGVRWYVAAIVWERPRSSRADRLQAHRRMGVRHQRRARLLLAQSVRLGAARPPAVVRPPAQSDDRAAMAAAAAKQHIAEVR